ncbi:hypothetical protein EVAR_8385_1 [Eumeta japonica]|uniref:Uncharacterized protein n=1 Tax=Eumeta variegata TaxID=151549 RepID=A0A4C1VDD8_EUMVA|nr:hypothetical protein EVAR_8385_1 [Eumeta japonica]
MIPQRALSTSSLIKTLSRIAYIMRMNLRRRRDHHKKRHNSGPTARLDTFNYVGKANILIQRKNINLCPPKTASSIKSSHDTFDCGTWHSASPAHRRRAAAGPGAQRPGFGRVLQELCLEINTPIRDKLLDDAYASSIKRSHKEYNTADQ